MAGCARLLIAGLSCAVVWACSDTKVVPTDPPEQLVPRNEYDTARPFESLVKPHFFATTENGEQVEPMGEPDLVTERDGKAKVRLRNGDDVLYLDPLALESEILGEHPVHKVYRLQAMGIPLAGQLEASLRSPGQAAALFHDTTFEYLRGETTTAVIVEVFPDGTFLAAPHEVPTEWRSSDAGMASPTHFHVDPRALSAGASDLAQRFETEVLALPFDDQRYPPARLARQECDVYKESIAAREYTRVLSTVGYRFSRDHVLRNAKETPISVGEELSLSLRGGAGEGVRYFGFGGYWVADRLAALGVPWTQECDTAGRLRRFRREDGSQGDFHITLRRSLEPDKTERYKIVRIGGDGSGQVIYSAPGIILMARPLPFDDDRWIMSTEGWKAPDDEGPPDPRWQSVYAIDLSQPDTYDIVQYPVREYPNAPEHGLLYGSSPAIVSGGSFLLSLLYGFKDEGGGLWMADISGADFYNRPDRFARVTPWDHALSWVLLESDADAVSPVMSIFLTGKEVADDFSMTANLLRIRSEGLDSTVESAARLLRMVGWNPVPFAIQRRGVHEFIVAVETHYNYEASLLPRAKGVYLLPVETRGGD